jgi:trehalose 6-phosphate synthase/phosphatase
MGESRVILVSNRLPVYVTKENGKYKLNRSVGGLATALDSVLTTHDALWVGWSGSDTDLPASERRRLQFPDQLVPLALSADLVHGYYDQVANGVLWPLLHGLTVSTIQTVTDTDWKAMQTVTDRFAMAMQKHLKPTDIVWIHDYHLLFLPERLRAAGVNNRIGFFLHTPFPDANFLLEWPQHRQLLRSLAQVDVLGFQTPRDAANFRVCLAGVGMSMKPGAVVRDFPIGVDYRAYRAAGQIVKVKSHLARLRAKLVGKRVILSVSRLDYTKGIIEQLYAVQQLLETVKHPSKLLYKLIVSPSREDISEYKNLKRDIEETVAAINARFARHGFRPIDYTYRNHGFEEVNAWFRLAHMLLVAPRIDGMNLVAKEYVAARENGQGALVLSENAGAAAQLKDAVLVDPLDVDAITDGLEQALRMPGTERKKRWHAMRQNVRTQDVFWWSERFLRELDGPKA